MCTCCFAVLLDLRSRIAQGTASGFERMALPQKRPELVTRSGHAWLLDQKLGMGHSSNSGCIRVDSAIPQGLQSGPFCRPNRPVERGHTWRSEPQVGTDHHRPIMRAEASEASEGARLRRSVTRGGSAKAFFKGELINELLEQLGRSSLLRPRLGL